MDKETRKTELEKIKNGNPVMTGIPINYKGERVKFDAFKIPLEYLIYNKYNGRISSRIKSFEVQRRNLDAEKPEDIEIIEKYLWESNIVRNKITTESLIKEQQQRFGIVTDDGIIIDGNRRAFLLNKIYRGQGQLRENVDHCRYFIAIILPRDASKRDIMMLETRYQMGVDERVDYDPIEKYLKCKDLGKEGFEIAEIAGLMGEKDSQIKQWLSILEIMEDYLDVYDYQGIYTRLEKREGPFVDLENYLKQYNNNRAHADWSYDELDINDLKTICLDYIRARYEGKEFRNIAKTSRGNFECIFSSEKIWKDFRDKHFDSRDSIDEKTVDDIRNENPGEDLSDLLKERDEKWERNIADALRNNLMYSTRKLEDIKEANEPKKLLEKVLDTLNSINTGTISFYQDSEVLELIKEISSLIWEYKKLIEKSERSR